MSEQITGEQLENSAGSSYSTIIECAECGTAIDTEQDHFGESLNREKFCCSNCLREFAKLSVLRLSHDDNYLATAWSYVDQKKGFDRESVESVHSVESIALKRVAEMAESVWGVKSYIERN